MNSIQEQITKRFWIFIWTNRNDNGILIINGNNRYKRFLINGLYKRRKQNEFTTAKFI
jgi:hypothetical protein